MPLMERDGDTNQVAPKRVETWLKAGWKLVKDTPKVNDDKVKTKSKLKVGKNAE